VVQDLQLKKMRNRHLILLSLIPLSEVKAVFYQSNLKVRYAVFSDNKLYLCNILEEYSNILIIGIVFYFLAFLKIDLITKKIALFLFIINALDFVFLGLMDNFLYLLKIPLSLLIFAYANSKISFQRN
jgi:hypothetical protein